MSIISNNHNFCFIHIHRTGGTTVKNVLAKQVDDIKTIYGNICTLEFAKNFCPFIEDYFKFSFVRNPYDLVVSIHSSITDKKTSDYYSIKDLTFYEFIQWLYDVGFKKEESPLYTFYRTQTDFLSINNKIGIDKIYKYETICNDAESSSIYSVLVNLGLSLNTKIPITNKSFREFLFQNYYDSKSYRLVNKIYKEDFKNFKYPMYVC